MLLCKTRTIIAVLREPCDLSINKATCHNIKKKVIMHTYNNVQSLHIDALTHNTSQVYA